MKIDKNIIQELSNYLEEFNLTEIEITEKDTKIKVSKNNVSINNQPIATPLSTNTISKGTFETSSVKSGIEITSPMPGKVIDVKVKKGKKVQAGDTLVILEAMKMEHSIKATESGTVSELLISVNDQVENGALLMVVK